MRAEQKIEQYPAGEFENIIDGDGRIREILKNFVYDLEIKIDIKGIRNLSFLPTQ